MAEYDALLTPFRLKGLTLRNRIVSTGHVPSYAEDGIPGERYQLYHAEKAKGGIGLTIFGGSSAVSPDCPAVFGQIYVGDDRVIPHFRRFSARVHDRGAALMCQITHMGRRARWDSGHWLTPVSPSPVREPEHRSFPKEMEDFDFVRIRGDFGRAARRCQKGGLDGIELSFSGSHLIPQFWSPGANRRTDEHGGRLENRLRFSLEVIDEVRRAVGEDFVVGVRISGDEMIDDGLDQEDCIEIAKALAADGKIDFLDVLAAGARDYRSVSILMPNMAYPPSPFLYLASAIRAVVDLPVLHAGRINDLATAARAIEDGHVDLVGMTRAHIADPHIVAKLRAGRAEDIRQCVGANYCVDRVLMAGDALCVQSPATGREAHEPHLIETGPGGQRVVVVGAGPAGLEAARVSALRGHRVVLFEAAEGTGGQVNRAARAGWREGLAGVTRWLDGQVRQAGVEIRLGTPADAAAVLAEDPDIVVVATGGRPNKGNFEGGDLAASTWDILDGTVAPAHDVLLYDDHGGHEGLSCAEFMAARGARVEYISPERYAGVEIGGTNWPVHLREMYKLGVVQTPDLRLHRVQAEGNRLVATLRNEYTLEEEEREVDQVVCEHGTLPDDELYFALRPLSVNLGVVDLAALIAGEPQTPAENPAGRFRLYRVGDAVASRNIHAAIYDSLRLCKVF